MLNICPISAWKRKAFIFCQWLPRQKPGCQSTAQAVNSCWTSGFFKELIAERFALKIWWKSHSINNGLPDIGLASCVWVQNNLVAKSRGFSPVKQTFWTNMWQVVRGRKASLVTNSVVYSLILRWISNECCCYLEIAGLESTWNVSTVPNQAAVLWLLPLLLCIFAFFCMWASPTLACFLFHLILDCCRFRITDGGSKTMSSTLCVASGVLRFFYL